MLALVGAPMGVEIMVDVIIDVKCFHIFMRGCKVCSILEALDEGNARCKMGRQWTVLLG